MQLYIIIIYLHTTIYNSTGKRCNDCNQTQIMPILYKRFLLSVITLVSDCNVFLQVKMYYEMYMRDFRLR